MIHFYTSSIAWFSDVFKGVQKWIIGLKWVKGTQFRTVPLAAEAYFAEGVECVFITIFTKSSTIDVWIHLWTECIRNFFSDFALLITAQKMKFSLNDFFSKCDQIFTEEILNGKLHFLCSEYVNIPEHLKVIVWNVGRFYYSPDALTLCENSWR